MAETTTERARTEDELQRWLGESGELVGRSEAAIKRHIAIMASVNLNLRQENARLRAQHTMALTTSPTSEYVERFAALMEGKLAANRHKGDRDGWLRDTPGDLLRRLREEADELDAAVMHHAPPEEIAAEAADVANFALMVCDRCGGLAGAEGAGR